MNRRGRVGDLHEGVAAEEVRHSPRKMGPSGVELVEREEVPVDRSVGGNAISIHIHWLGYCLEEELIQYNRKCNWYNKKSRICYRQCVFIYSGTSVKGHHINYLSTKDTF